MDRLTPEQRKKAMQSNKSKGTKPELLLAKTLWHKGLRYRKNNQTVFGRPDITFKKYKIAVFVDGEFWHGKNWPVRKHDIKSNRAFWIGKIERNMQRDLQVNGRLEQEGWLVLRFWSKDVLKHPDVCAARIEHAICERKKSARNEIERKGKTIQTV